MIQVNYSNKYGISKAGYRDYILYCSITYLNIRYTALLYV